MTNFDDHYAELAKSADFRCEYALRALGAQIADEIKAKRMERGWSQSDLSHRLKTAQSRVSQMEDPLYGKFTLTSLIRVADALNCKLHVEFLDTDVPALRTMQKRRSLSALTI